jgi:O-antigen ligase
MKLITTREVAASDALIPRAPDHAPGTMRAKPPRGAAFKRGLEGAVKRNPDRVAFVGVVLFTLLLYLRPQEMFPELFGAFPLVKLVGAGALAAYILGRLHRGERITILPTELKMVFTIWTLGWVMLPFAQEPGRSLEMLTDTYLKVTLVFMLMVNLLNNRERLLLVVKLITLCGGFLGVGAIRSYMRGEFTLEGLRIEGMVGGIFGNPNDLATSFDMLIPLAVFLVMTQRGLWRFLSLVCAAVMAVGVVVTFSRAGFLGLTLTCGFLLWKLGQKSRARTVTLALLAGGLLLLLIPSGYTSRLSTILDNKSDKTGSALERREIMDRALSLAVRRPIIGVGMNNFSIYSVKDRLAHNSYLEIAAELGVFGLIAYLILIFKPLNSCRLIERQTRPQLDEGESRVSEYHDPVARRRRELYLLSIGLQATFYAYILCSFFASIQYLWFIYYPVAYVVALRGIREIEESKEAEGAAPADIARPAMGRARGALWKLNQKRKGKGGAGVLRKKSAVPDSRS